MSTDDWVPPERGNAEPIGSAGWVEALRRVEVTETRAVAEPLGEAETRAVIEPVGPMEVTEAGSTDRGRPRTLLPQGPAVVAVGGGHGQAATLRAARSYASSLTAVVSVADDGGSSGRLRRDLGIVPPGDLRTCLGALASPDSVLAQAFEHRFEGAALTGSDADLGGHALGNLVLTGLLAVTGDVQAAVDEAARLLGAVGRVVPATYEPVVLAAEAACGAVEGQSNVARTPKIRRLSLVPVDVAAASAAVAAIAAADQVVLGPGSLYTSVLAAASVVGISAALRGARAQRVYVANLRPQPGETEGYDVADHVAAMLAHGIEVDLVLYDGALIDLGTLPTGVRAVDRPLAKPNGLAHDSRQLAQALVDLVGYEPRRRR